MSGWGIPGNPSKCYCQYVERVRPRYSNMGQVPDVLTHKNSSLDLIHFSSLFLNAPDSRQGSAFFMPGLRCFL